jgi:AAA15 family ATPase/GTPase
VNNAIVYGYNGAGKSNLGLAMMDIIQHLTDKNKRPELYENYINGDSNDIAEFIYCFKFDNDSLKYKYGKSNVENIIYEDLEINNKKIISYDRRQGQDLKINLPGTETLNKDIDQIKISVLKYIKSNAVLDDSKDSITFNKLLVFVDGMLLFWQLMNRGYIGYKIGVTGMFNDIIEQGHFDDFKNFLESAGVVENIGFSKNANGDYEVYCKFENRQVVFWDICSTGTKSLVLFYYWLQRLKSDGPRPSFLFIDEFDAFYHQELSEFVVKELKESPCQVVLTTHNTSIMTNDLLRPDCYYLMFKDKIKSIASLTDKELRFGNNIEKMYRAGAFDGRFNTFSL